MVNKDVYREFPNESPGEIIL